MEREWYDAHTKRMLADVEVMKANLDINAQAAQDAAMIMAAGATEMPEEQTENEQLEQMVIQPNGPANMSPPGSAMPQAGPAPSAGAKPRATGRRSSGAMTRKPNIEALSGETKPGEESNE